MDGQDRIVTFGGKTHRFPKDATDAEIAEALERADAPPPPAEAPAPRSAVSRAVGGTLTGAGLTPDAIGQTISGLINLASDPKKIPGVLKASLIDPLAKFSDPAMRGRLGTAIASGGTKVDPQLLETLPAFGPGFTQARERVESGDVAGGLGEYVGQAVTGPLAWAKAPAVARSVGNVGRTPGIGLARSTLDSTRPAAQAALDEGLLWRSVAAGKRKATDLSDELNQQARDIAGTTTGINPRAIGHGPDVQATYRTLEPPQTKAGAAPLVGQVVNDPRLTRGRVSDAVQVAENLDRNRLGRSTVGTSNEAADTAMGRSVADELRRQSMAAAPDTTPALSRLGPLNEARDALTTAGRNRRTGLEGVPPLLSIYSLAPWLLKRSQVPASQMLYRGGQAAEAATTPLMRAAILSQLARERDQEPER